MPAKAPAAMLVIRIIAFPASIAAQHDGCLRRYTFAATCEAEPFGCGRFDVNASCVDREEPGDGFLYRLLVRADFGSLANDREIGIGDMETRLSRKGDGMFHELCRTRAAPLRVAR